MNGSIRMIVGFLVVFGALGTLDADPEASVVIQAALALVGCMVLGSGVLAMKKQNIG
jgi:hypothetical protein